ncbi:hypothetical protein NXV59_00030 [Bacteroides fragilis]|nr:hypothetical protein [Bacteroides fragilis]
MVIIRTLDVPSAAAGWTGALGLALFFASFDPKPEKRGNPS